ncbi:hypothetical protein SOMG_03371 [Schizosaccharomyces osmophilus]|uniref:Uncharacterized protein n=1 Tax=Schizosaccharomyces osmophilus TaxID=2545709 RepID=A0AAF0AVX6_9SCHI|nr:uncharacterized protein SOMG_03371 [Schizosaccharomyces osmophilus]WBW74056.1 hypothetical protein SOMG_03371 [Schizosaccharomyces osmophilus]
MLLSCGLSALLFAGACVASTPSLNPNAPVNGKWEQRSKPDQNIVKTEEKMFFIPFDEKSQGFLSCDLINPFSDNEHEPAYADIVQKPNANGTVHYSFIEQPDLFQAFKHAIDGDKDYKFLKGMVKKGFLDYGFINNYNFTTEVGPNYFKRNITKPCMACFFGYQEIEPTDDEPEPIIGFDYRSNDEEPRKSEHRIFVGLSVLASVTGLYWLLRCLWRPKSFTFTQFLLFFWYSAFLANHPVKQALFMTHSIVVHPFGFFLPTFSYLLGDGIERPLFNSFVLALTLGIGYLQRSSKKLVFLVLFLNWIQSLFIFFAPFIFLFLDLSNSTYALILQLVWKLFQYGYLPFFFCIRMIVVYRMRLKPAHAFEDELTQTKKGKILVFLIFPTVTVSGYIYSQYAPAFDTGLEVAKSIVGVLCFQILAFCLNGYIKPVNDHKLEHLQTPLSIYKDEPEMNLLGDEKN